ncbi:hypothetical protein ACQP3C_30035, partial [Escherichia coli]
GAETSLNTKLGLKQHPQISTHVSPGRILKSTPYHTFLDQHPKDFKATSTFPKDEISGSWRY